MFKQTFLGDYRWEITPRISLHFVNDEYISIGVYEPKTSVEIDTVTYTLKGDFRKEFEATGGDLEKIKKVYLDNVENTELNVPSGESYAPLIRVFTEHINQHIK